MTYKNMDHKKKYTPNDPNIETRKGSISERLSMLAKRGTTREVAKRWGISVSTLDRYINQGSMPSLDRAVAIAEAEGVSINWLAMGAESPTNQSERAEPLESSADDVVINQLSQEEKHKLARRIISKGASSLDLNEAQDRWAALVADLDTQAEREIFAFAKKAKYMWLAGVPFNTPADIDQWNERRA